MEVVRLACGLDAVDVDIDVFVAGLFDLRHFGETSALRSLERAASKLIIHDLSDECVGFSLGCIVAEHAA